MQYLSSNQGTTGIRGGVGEPGNPGGLGLHGLVGPPGEIVSLPSAITITVLLHSYFVWVYFTHAIKFIQSGTPLPLR